MPAVIPARSHRILAAVVCLAALTAALAAQKLEVKAQKDPQADFAAFRTYVWLPPAPAVMSTAPDLPRNPTLSQEVLGPHIVAAVDRELAARGFTKVDDPAKADVSVVYGAALIANFSSSFLGEHYGYITGWGSPIAPGLAPTTSVSMHEKGTVVVEMVQRATNRGVWSGTVQTRILHEHTVEKRVQRINEGISRLFERFPTKARK